MFGINVLRLMAQKNGHSIPFEHANILPLQIYYIQKELILIHKLLNICITFPIKILSVNNIHFDWHCDNGLHGCYPGKIELDNYVRWLVLICQPIQQSFGSELLNI